MLPKMITMMPGREKIIFFTLASCLVLTGTLAQGTEEGFYDVTEDFGPLEVTKGDDERSKSVDLRLPQESDVAQAMAALRLQDEEALAAIFGTRRRGGHRNITSQKPDTRRGCVTEGAVFAEGSAMVSPDECSYCFCIRGKQRCVAPKCLLPVEGCRPRYRTFSCCPSFYDCHDASTTTTTTSRTPTDCNVDGVRYPHGALVSEGAGGQCQNCYCFDGHVNCTTITCAPPLDGCKPVMQEGHCCPVKYDCEDGHRRVAVDEFYKDFPVKINAGEQRKQFDTRRPEWHTNMARKSPGGEAIISDAPEEQVERFGHAGEAILVEDLSEFENLPIHDAKPFKLDEPIQVGTGVNVKGDLNDAVAFGPILIHDNRVRTDRQNKDLNDTEVDGITVAENTAATDVVPEETTMLTIDEINMTDDAMANGETSADYETGTEEMTTLFPAIPSVQETTAISLSELLLSRATAASSTTTMQRTTEIVPPITPDTTDDIPDGDPDYTDIETAFPSYDITVGTSVMATNQARPPSSVVGEVISVELEPEHKTDKVESSPTVENERPSLFGTLLNILTRTDSRPSRIPPPPPPPPPSPPRIPFRPRPRPNGRPERRPDFIPPRFRPSPPPVALERDTTEEPEIATSPSTEQPIIPTKRPQSFVIPTTQPPPAANNPVSGFSIPKPVVNSPVYSLIQTNLNRPDFTPNQPVAVVPQVNNPSTDDAGLPSEPVIEGGFQGMKEGNQGIQPNFDFDYDSANPTLPPSLPNLKIIPFVAADALVNQEIGIAGDDFKTPLLLTQTGDDNPENQRVPETTDTTTTTTTTRRPFNRQSIIGSRRPIPPLRRPASRPFAHRPHHGAKPPTSNKSAQEEGENKPTGTERESPNTRPSVFPFPSRDRPITRPPFVPPRWPTPTTTDTTTQTTTTTTTTTPTRHPRPSTTNTPRTIVSEDIANLLLLQDEFVLPGGQNAPPVRFAPDRSTRKPIIPLLKAPPALPDIPDSVKDQLPLAADPLFISGGELKLSGCNVYGRMYEVGGRIKELSKGCKECRCTPVGVQCLPKPSC